MSGWRRILVNVRATSLDGIDRAFVVRWVPVGVVVGAVAGAGAIALHWLLDVVTTYALGDLVRFVPASVAGDGPVHPASAIGRPWVLPVVIVGGALVSSVIVRLLAPETGGHGTDAAIDRIHHDPKGMRTRVTVVKIVASALTLGSGGSGGTEGPAAQVSAAFGSLVSRVFRLSTDEARVAVAAGLASGVGAIFRAPLGGALLGVELPFRRDMAAEMLLPSLIASIVSYLEFAGVYGFRPMLGEHQGTLFSAVDLPLFLVLGLLAGLATRAFCWTFYRLKTAFDGWHRMPVALRPVVGAVVVGGIGLLLPGVLGTGYGGIQSDMDGRWVLGTSLWVLLALPLAKIVATSLTVGSGGSAGVFGPGMVIGAGVGTALWRILDTFGLPMPGPAVFVIAGMAACLGSAIHAPIALIVMSAEITGTVGAVLPSVMAVLTAVLVVGDVTLYRSQPQDRSSTSAPAAVSAPAHNPESWLITEERKMANQLDQSTDRVVEPKTEPSPTIADTVNEVPSRERWPA